MFSDKKQSMTYRVNAQIRSPRVMLIQDEKNLGIFSREEALKIAGTFEMDLVEVSPAANPPVCRIMDYGKFKYEQSLKEKEKKKNQRQSQDKELRLSSAIDDHDLAVKINAAKKFLEKNHRVLFRLQYKARQNTHKELGIKVIEKISEALVEIGTPQSQPKIEGKCLTCTFNPKK